MPSVGFTEMLTGRCGLNEEWAVRIWCDLLLLTQTPGHLCSRSHIQGLIPRLCWEATLSRPRFYCILLF